MDNQPNFFTGMARIIGTYLWVKGMEVLTEKKESEPKALEIAKFLTAYKMLSALPWIAGLPRKTSTLKRKSTDQSSLSIKN